MKNYLLLFFLSILTLNCFAQDKYSFVGYFGLCDFRFVHPENLLYPGDQYKPSFSFKAGLYNDLFTNKKPKIYPTIGLSVTGKYQSNYMGTHILPYGVPYGVSRDKFITIDLPIALNYQIINWLKIKGGLNGSAFVMGLNRGPTERQIFTYGYLLALSMRYRQYSFNIEYVREVNDMLRHVRIEDASYRSSTLHFGIGYHFYSFKQFKGLLK